MERHDTALVGCVPVSLTQMTEWKSGTISRSVSPLIAFSYPIRYDTIPLPKLLHPTCTQSISLTFSLSIPRTKRWNIASHWLTVSCAKTCCNLQSVTDRERIENVCFLTHLRMIYPPFYHGLSLGTNRHALMYEKRENDFDFMKREKGISFFPCPNCSLLLPPSSSSYCTRIVQPVRVSSVHFLRCPVSIPLSSQLIVSSSSSFFPFLILFCLSLSASCFASFFLTEGWCNGLVTGWMPWNTKRVSREKEKTENSSLRIGDKVRKGKEGEDGSTKEEKVVRTIFIDRPREFTRGTTPDKARVKYSRRRKTGWNFSILWYSPPDTSFLLSISLSLPLPAPLPHVLCYYIMVCMDPLSLPDTDPLVSLFPMDSPAQSLPLLYRSLSSLMFGLSFS